MRYISALVILLSMASYAMAGNPLTPTTTLAAETGNNTSAADTFKSQSNGNIGATNVSKVSLKTLMYPGFAGKLYVHMMPWFGPSNHMGIGYDSSSAAQVTKQVDDIVSRGADGVIIDWYGPESTHHDTASKYFRDEANRRGGKFEFAIMEDVGALKACMNKAGCDVTQKLINDMTYIANTYFTSQYYIRKNGRPIIPLFGLEAVPNIDWNRVQKSAPGNPMIIWRNASGFTKYATSGSFSWVNPNASNPSDTGLTYLNNYYAVAVKYPTLLSFATGYKGFNDKLALWSANRVMNQNCGQTWLDSMAVASKYYKAGNDTWVQLATWNDYEEGTEIESGIENCVTINASMSGSTLKWSISGKENTLDHYEVFASTDGLNLAKLADVATGKYSLDVSQYALDQATYKLYVKAVGKPSIVNKMSNAVTWTGSGSGTIPGGGSGTTNQSPIAKLSVTPTSGSAPVTVSANTTGSSDPDGSIASVSINWGDGSSTNAASGSHTYTVAGTYTVTATVVDNQGASGTARQTVTVAGSGSPSQGSGVTVQSPAANTTVGTSVQFVASASGATTMKIYVDHNAVYSVNASSLNTTLTLAAGTRNVTVQAWDAKGTVYKNTFTLTVSGTQTTPTPTPTTGVTLVSPVNGSTSGTSVRVAATASAATTITAMRVYVDNVSVYAVNGNKIDTYLKMATGQRYVVVQAWDQKGNVYKQPAYVTVK